MSETRRELDPTFKQVLLDFLAPLPVTVQTEVEISRLPRTMDALVLVESEDAHGQVRLHTPFQHFRTHNQIEFKGEHDRLTMWDYHHILGRTHLYMGENKVTLDDMSVTVICAGKPKTVLQTALSPHLFTSLGDGQYRRHGFPEVTIIAVNELPVTPNNYPFLLFASSERKFREIMDEILSKELLEYVVYAYRVRPDVTQELLIMASVYQDNVKRFAELAGGDIIRNMSPRQMIELMDSDQIQSLKSLLGEQVLWETIEAAETVNRRIIAIVEMSANDRTIVLNEANRERLLVGLNETEQRDLLAWVTSRT